jgi:DNA (cytosine-5)-methyltransferase 1
MRFGSLFAGIGGLDLGLERAGMQCVWQSEIDPYARRVLEKHWPNVHRHDDVRTAGAGNLEPVDLICGGFPCQDISVAGKGAGLAGARSGLWREYARIVDEVRPRWVLIENVPALRTRGLRTVLSDLHACGYDAEWDGLSAAHVGAPHRRDRLFVVAHSRSESLRLQQRRGRWANGPRTFVFGRDGQPRDVADANGAGLALGGEQSARVEQPTAERAGAPSHPWTSEPDVGRVAHGVPARVDRLRCLGNAVVPQVAERIGRLIMSAAGADEDVARVS